MKRILNRRQIRRLYHFTQVENLSNIYKYGLLPRDILEYKEIYSCFNDEYRNDKCLNAVCMSIEFPNYKMFYKLRQDNPDVNWAVLQLDAQILCDYKCAFCWTNAGDSTICNIPLKDRMGTQAFLRLFEDNPNYPQYPQREKLNISDRYPTNPQAEVLVFGIIPNNYIKNVYFNKKLIFDKYKNDVPDCIDASVNTTYFDPRIDWKFW